MVKVSKTFLFTKTFSEFFSSVWAVTPVWVLGSLPVQAKTLLYSISGIASTACVMTQGEIASTACVYTQDKIASTAYGRPQADFSQIFSCGNSVKIGLHRGISPNPFILQNQNFLAKKDVLSLKIFPQSQHTFIYRILIFYLIPIHEDMTILCTSLVPSYISVIFASRIKRSNGNSLVDP